MGYTRQYFSDGNILAATHLNHIEEGIEAVSGRADKLAEDVAVIQEKIKNSAGDVFALVTGQKPPYSFAEGVTYAKLINDWGASKRIVLYRYVNDASGNTIAIRYYCCMGTAKREGLSCLAFNYNFGNENESIWVASDNSITIESGGGSVARISNVTLSASAWVGSDSLHSQEVTIDGVTPYSKVDLLPSVEQLAIFHDKDVAFVTENEDGIVTVYAIGDKPTQDYTMQVSITEVVA